MIKTFVPLSGGKTPAEVKQAHKRWKTKNPKRVRGGNNGRSNSLRSVPKTDK